MAGWSERMHEAELQQERDELHKYFKKIRCGRKTKLHFWWKEFDMFHDWPVLLDALEQSPFIESLHFDASLKNLTADEQNKVLSRIANLLKTHPKIYGFGLTQTDFSGLRFEGMNKIFEALCVNTTIKKLDLSCNKLHGTVLHLENVLIQNTTIETLALCGSNTYGTNITFHGMHWFAEGLRRNNGLKLLDLSNNRDGFMDPALLDYLADALASNPTLTTLVMSGNGIGTCERNMANMSKILQSKTIRNVDLTGNCLGTVHENGIASMRFIADALDKNPETSIEVLTLSSNSIGCSPQSMEALSDIIARTQTIRRLFLRSVGFDRNEENMQILANCLSINTSIEHLDIYGNNIGAHASGFGWLASIFEHNSTIHWLNIDYNCSFRAIERDSEYLLKALKYGSIKRLCYTKFDFPDHMVARIEEQLRQNNAQSGIPLQDDIA